MAHALSMHTREGHRAMTTPLPGFGGPAVTFEQPFEMLEACHDRVRDRLALLRKLVAHVDAQGHDAQSRAAARDVMRYFDVAAPLHHQDEELHVFPKLLAQGTAEQAGLVRALLTDHERMGGIWSRLRVPLSRWGDPGVSGPIGQDTRQLVDEFCAVYDSHLANEERLAFPAVRPLVDEQELVAMGAEMQRRRRS